MIFTQPWLLFALTAGVGLVGYNLSAKLGGGNLPPVVFATIMYAAGLITVVPLFLMYMRDKELSFLSSLPLPAMAFAAVAGVSVILVDTSVALMFGKGAPMGLGMTLVSIISLGLTLVVGLIFLNERHSMINVAGLALALIAVPLMLYSTN